MVGHDGSLDPAFGDHGKAVTDVTGGLDQVRDLRLLDGGKFLVAGLAGDQFAVARYDTDGTLDPTFGNGGVVVTTDGFPGTAYTVRAPARRQAARGRGGHRGRRRDPADAGLPVRRGRVARSDFR